MRTIKNKGFTLVELLGVISILAIIIGLSVATFTNVRKNVLEKEYENVKSVIETKAANYAKETGITTVSVEKLINEGYLEPDDETDIYNPVNNTSMNCYVLKAEFVDEDYISTIIKEFPRRADGTCDAYEETTDFAICKMDSSGNCDIIRNDDWFKENIKLGVKYRNGNKIDENKAQFEWTSNTGNQGYESTIETNATSVAESTYKVKVILENTIGEASQEIRIDMQAPVVVESKVEGAWTAEKSVEIIASDFTGSGVKGIYVGNESICKNVPIGSYKEAVDGKITEELAEGEFHICVVDKVGNYSDEAKSVKVDNVDSEGADTISLNPSTTGWARQLDLIGKAQDLKSGLVAYQFTTSSSKPTTWIDIEKTNAEITQRKSNVTANGTYYFWVKDAIGNTSSASYKLEKIDNTGADTISLSPSTTAQTKSLTLTGRATDTKSGIVKYQITTSSSLPTSGWTTTKATASVVTTKGVNKNGIYYFWVVDAVGNASSARVNIINIDNEGPTYISGGNVYLGGATQPNFTDKSNPIRYYYYVSTSYNQPAASQITASSPYFSTSCGNNYYVWVKAVDALGNYTIKLLGSIYSGDCCNPAVYQGRSCNRRGWYEEEYYNECTGRYDYVRTDRPCESEDTYCDRDTWCDSRGREYKTCYYYYGGVEESYDRRVGYCEDDDDDWDDGDDGDDGNGGGSCNSTSSVMTYCNELAYGTSGWEWTGNGYSKFYNNIVGGQCIPSSNKCNVGSGYDYTCTGCPSKSGCSVRRSGNTCYYS